MQVVRRILLSLTLFLGFVSMANAQISHNPSPLFYHCEPVLCVPNLDGHYECLSSGEGACGCTAFISQCKSCGTCSNGKCTNGTNCHENGNAMIQAATETLQRFPWVLNPNIAEIVAMKASTPDLEKLLNRIQLELLTGQSKSLAQAVISVLANHHQLISKTEITGNVVRIRVWDDTTGRSTYPNVFRENPNPSETITFTEKEWRVSGKKEASGDVAIASKSCKK